MRHIINFLLNNYTGLKDPKKRTTKILIAACAVISGLLAGCILNGFVMGPVISSAEKLQDHFLVILFIFPLVRMLFPVYKLLPDIVKSYYPVSNINKMVINILMDILSDFFIFLFIFLVFVTMISEDLTFLFLIRAYLILLGSHLLRRIIQNIIENRYTPGSYLLISLVILISAGFSLFLFFSGLSGLIKTTGIFMIILLSDYLVETACRVQRLSFSSITDMPVKNIYRRLLFFNKNVRVSLIISGIVRLAFFVTDLIFVKRTGRHIMDGNLLYWIFIVAPVYYFSYVFNNLWGYYRSLWLQLKIHHVNDWRPYFRVFYRLLITPLLPDIVISLTFLLILWDEKLFALSYYLTSLIFLSCFAIHWSFLYPAYMTNASVFKVSNTPLGNFFCLFSTGLLFLMKLDPWFFLLIPVYMLMSVYMVIKVKQNIEKDHYDLFLPLFTQ